MDHEEGTYTMDCNLVDQLSAAKAPALLLQENAMLNNTNTGPATAPRNDVGNVDNLSEHPDNKAMMQGSVIFDMLSAMHFSHPELVPTIDGHQHHHHQSASINNTNTTHDATSPNLSTSHDPSDHKFNYLSELNLYHNPRLHLDDTTANDQADVQNTASNNYNNPPMKDQGFDPVSFLKLPNNNNVPDHVKLGLMNDPRFLAYNNREDPIYHSSLMQQLQAANPGSSHYGSVNNHNNNNWVTSLQLETIASPHGNCSDVINDVPYNSAVMDDSDEAATMIKLSSAELTFPIGGDSGMDHYSQLQAYQAAYNTNNGDVGMAYHNSSHEPHHHHPDHLGSGIHSMMSTGIGTATGTTTKGPKRKRAIRGSCKNSEERENQRMTHIAVERNRRRQMNEHLRVLRALMPPSYVQRGDQASIIGGAIEFVRELEQLLQCLESQKRRKMMANPAVPGSAMTNINNNNIPPGAAVPNANNLQNNLYSPEQIQMQMQMQMQMQDNNINIQGSGVEEEIAQAKSSMADIEVKLVDKYDALIKILSQRRPRQLLNTISALEGELRFIIVHTNVTTIDNTVLYSFTVKVNNEGDLTAEQIATSVHEIFIQLITQTPIKESM